MHHTISRDRDFGGLSKATSYSACMYLKVFHTLAFLTKLCFVLGQKQAMLVNDESSSWNNEEEKFLMSVWDRRKKFCVAMDQ